MPLSGVAEFVAELIFRPIFDGCCYFTGRVLIGLFTSRNIHVYVKEVNTTATEKANWRTRRRARRLARLKKQPNDSGNELRINFDTVMLIGLCFWVFLGLLAWALIVYVL
jgi:hypothetical protein